MPQIRRTTILDLELEALISRWPECKLIYTFNEFIETMRENNVISEWMFNNVTIEDVENKEDAKFKGFTNKILKSADENLETLALIFCHNELHEDASYYNEVSQLLIELKNNVLQAEQNYLDRIKIMDTKYPKRKDYI